MAAIINSATKQNILSLIDDPENSPSLLHLAVDSIVLYAQTKSDSSIADRGNLVSNLTASTNWWNVIKLLIISGDVHCDQGDLDNISPIVKFANAEMWEYCKHMVEMGAGVDKLSHEQQVNLLGHVADLPALELSIGNNIDAQVHRAFYNIIRLNNCHLLDLILDEWFQKYGDDRWLLLHTGCILSDVNEEIRCIGVQLSKEMEYAIDDRLIGSHFFSNNQAGIEVQSSADAMKMRAEMIRKTITVLVDKYFGDLGIKEVDEEFIHDARFVARNIHILKRQMKSKLPWEKMEFCIASFIFAHENPQEFNALVLLVMDKDKLLSHLNNFASILENEIQLEFSKDEANSKPVTPRDPDTSRFEELYEDYDAVKTVFSLKRIEAYIGPAIAVDLRVRKDVGTLVVERALQVIGESLKNTSDSPNVPDSVHKLLLSSAPRNVREIITSLRDSLSHAHTLNNRFALEEGKDSEFFNKIQNDLKKIAQATDSILYEKKVDAVAKFMSRVVDVDDIQVVKTMTRVLKEINLGELPLEHEDTLEIAKISSLLAKLRNELKELADCEINWFNEIEAIIESQRSNLRNVKQAFVNFSSVSDAFQIDQNLNSLKTLARHFQKWRAPTSCPLSKILPYLEKIFYNRTENTEIASLFYAIVSCIKYEGTRIKAIDSFKEKLEKTDTGDDLEIEARNQLENGLEEITRSLPEDDKRTVQTELQNMKQFHDSKIKIGDMLLANCDNNPSSQQECLNLFASLNVKKAQAKKFDDMFKKCKFGDCKKILDNMRGDEYQNLFSSIKNAIAAKKTDNIRELLVKFVKSKVKNFDLQDQSNIIAEHLHLQKYYERRLQLLKVILSPINGEKGLQNYLKDRALQIAVEMLVLDLTEILQNLSRLADNRLFLDATSPVLIGRSLRNYLAHGDCLIDILPFDTTLAVLSNAIRFVHHENLVTGRTELIGRPIKVEPHTLSEIETWHSRTLACISHQRQLFSEAQKGNLEGVVSCIENGRDITAKTHYGWTAFHFAARGGNKDVMRYLLDNNFKLDCYRSMCKSFLCIASEYGNVDIVKYLVEVMKVEVSDVDPDHNSLLHLAVQHGHENIVMLLLGKDNVAVNAVCQKGKTPLHYAALHGNQGIARELIAKGANVSACDCYDVTPLHFAALNGHTDVALQLLLDKGVDVNAISVRGLTPLHCAAYHGHRDVAVALMVSGADVAALNKSGKTPLWQTILNGHVDVVEALLEKGAKLDDPYLDYLHLAAVHGYVGIVRILLEHGAEVDARTEDNNCTALLYAAENGHCDVVKVLLEKGALVNAVMKTSLTPLHVAANNGHKEVCAVVVDSGADVESKDERGLTACHLAASNGHRDVIQELISRKVDIHSRCRHGRTPLHLATRNAHPSVVELLIANGAQVDAQDENKVTPLFIAAEEGHEDIVNKLLGSLKGHVDQLPNSERMTPLHVAAKSGHKGIVSLLLEKDGGASMNALDQNGHSALLLAAKFGHKNVVTLLVSNNKKAIVGSCDERRSCLYEACKNGFRDIVSCLINAGANANEKGQSNRSCLHIASMNGHADVVSTLLDNGADANALCGHNSTPLLLAVKHGHLEVVVVLLQKGCDVNMAGGNGNTALYTAAEHGMQDMVAVLLEHGADADLKAPLLIAIQNGHEAICECLLAKGADVNVCDGDGETALHWAAIEGNSQVMEALLQGKAKMNVQNKAGMTPLHLAAQQEYAHVVSILLDAGADIKPVNEDGNAALHTASLLGNTEIVQGLLDDGAEINEAGNLGFTPLHFAVYEGHEDVVNMLIANGACVDAVMNTGMTPLHLAARFNRRGIVLDLLRNGANIDAFTNAGMMTPLHVAAAAGSLDALNALLDNGAGIETPAKSKLTPLHVAAKNGQSDIVASLLNRGADIEAKADDNATALHSAARFGHRNVITVLLERNANVLALTSKSKVTPAHIALEHNHSDIAVELFLLEKAAALCADFALQLGK